MRKFLVSSESSRRGIAASAMRIELSPGAFGARHPFDDRVEFSDGFLWNRFVLVHRLDVIQGQLCIFGSAGAQSDQKRCAGRPASGAWVSL